LQFDSGLYATALVVDSAYKLAAASMTAPPMPEVNQLTVISVLFMLQGSHRSWNVLEFKSHIFQAWKVLESGLGPVKSWRVKWVMEMQNCK